MRVKPPWQLGDVAASALRRRRDPVPAVLAFLQCAGPELEDLANRLSQEPEHGMQDQLLLASAIQMLDDLTAAFDVDGQSNFKATFVRRARGAPSRPSGAVPALLQNAIQRVDEAPAGQTESAVVEAMNLTGLSRSRIYAALRQYRDHPTIFGFLR